MRLVVLALLAACGGSPQVVPTVKPAGDTGSHKADVAALAQPLVDAEITTSVVVGIYDAGRSEIYGFGKGPDGLQPTGTTLYEIGAITEVFTTLILADATQRREIALDTHLSELVPPGVTVPSIANSYVTLAQLATGTSGFPRQPPSLVRLGNADDPYGKYNEDALYGDLIKTSFEGEPGKQVVTSTYGTGVLGFVLGRKLGGGLTKVMQTRVLGPLALASTFFVVPDGAKSRRAVGSNLDLKPVPYWTWDALAGAGGLISSASDQLAMIDAELDAASGSKQPLRAAMRLSQEEQLPLTTGPNLGLGWNIDSEGRYWHDGSTGGFRSFVGFDPKTRRGVVILSSSAVSLVDHLAADLYKVMAKETVTPFKAPPIASLAPYAGTYQLGEFKLVVSIEGNRVYITGRGERPLRLVPLSDHEMWFEGQQAVVVFEKENDKVARAVFLVNGQRLAAARVPE